MEFSSTEVRAKAERNEDITSMVAPSVAEYIVKNQIWTPAGRIVRYTSMIEGGDERAELYIERGKCYFQHNEWGKAINDFNRAKAINPDNAEAKQLHDIVYGHYILRRDIHLLHLVPIERHIMIYILHQFLKSFTLQFAQFLTTHAFFVWIPDHSLFVNGVILSERLHTLVKGLI